MQYFNLQLFTLLNAQGNLSGGSLFVAMICAKYLVYLIPLSFLIIWWRGNLQLRITLISAALVASFALLISYAIGMFAYQPRPFVLGVGNTFLMHAPNASFPSHHMTFLWAVGLTLCGNYALCWWGVVSLAIALLVGWARVFLGVHFPFDILGGILVATIVYLLFYGAKMLLQRRKLVFPFEKALLHK